MQARRLTSVLGGALLSPLRQLRSHLDSPTSRRCVTAERLQLLSQRSREECSPFLQTRSSSLLGRRMIQACYAPAFINYSKLIPRTQSRFAPSLSQPRPLFGIWLILCDGDNRCRQPAPAR